MQGVHPKYQPVSSQLTWPPQPAQHTPAAGAQTSQHTLPSKLPFISLHASAAFPALEKYSKHKKYHKDDELEDLALIDKYQGISQKEI